MHAVWRKDDNVSGRHGHRFPITERLSLSCRSSEDVRHKCRIYPIEEGPSLPPVKCVKSCVVYRAHDRFQIPGPVPHVLHVKCVDPLDHSQTCPHAIGYQLTGIPCGSCPNLRQINEVKYVPGVWLTSP